MPGSDVRLTLPHPGFNRGVGIFAGHHFSPAGEPLGADEWVRRRGEWLPTNEDYAFVASLMQPVTEPGRMAGWIAPPLRGTHGKPIEFEYVRFN